MEAEGSDRADETTHRGRFIVFEGGDGTGKSTQARLFADRVGAVFTREPGGTPISEAIRDIVLDADRPEMVPRTEALLMAAARAQHVHELIVPTIEAGRNVVCDRFVASSLAYQGVGRALGVDAVLAINEFATAGLRPDLVVLLEIDSEVARERLGDDLDRIERSGSDLARRVAATYREFAAAHPDRWVIVDGSGAPDAVGDRVAAAVADRLGALA